MSKIYENYIHSRKQREDRDTAADKLDDEICHCSYAFKGWFALRNGITLITFFSSKGYLLLVVLGISRLSAVDKTQDDIVKFHCS